MGRPVPTARAAWVAAAGLAPTLLAALVPGAGALALAVDAALLALLALDFALAPRARSLSVRREVAKVLSVGRPSRVVLELAPAPGRGGAIAGEVRDEVSPGPTLAGHRQRFLVTGTTRLEWTLTPSSRGDVRFEAAWLRLDGPLGLCARQERVALPADVKVYPDLTVLGEDALALARSEDLAARRVQRARGEGREFESLRDHRPGDDRRAIDWKATARRGRALVRVHQPERNQQVLLLLDCGRHMTGTVDGKRKLDHAVDAALRLSRVALALGDLVGVVAYGRGVQAWLPPGRGAEHLRAIAHALYRVEASLEESDVGAALDRAFARGARRSLVVLLTDLLDEEAAAGLLARTRRLVPRHLPLVVSLSDEALLRAATAVPALEREAFERVVAARLVAAVAATAAHLRLAGARVVQAPPSRFGASSVSAYLDVKARGAL